MINNEEEMMIKFRAWDKKTKEYFHIYELWNSGTNPECFNFDGWTDNFGNNGRLKDIVIEQFIGLKDVNGKEIYEGDIVHCENDYQGTDYTGKVMFFNGGFCVWTGGFRNYVWEDMIPEIIGNVHTNPELLED